MNKILKLSLVAAVVSAPLFATSAPEKGIFAKSWDKTKGAASWCVKDKKHIAGTVVAGSALVGGVSYAAYRYFKAPAKNAAVNADALLTSSVASKGLSERSKEVLNFIATHKKLVALTLAAVAVVGFEVYDYRLQGAKAAVEEAKDVDGKVTTAAQAEVKAEPAVEGKRFGMTKTAYNVTKDWTTYSVKKAVAYSHSFEKPTTLKGLGHDAAVVGVDLVAVITFVAALDLLAKNAGLEEQMQIVRLLNHFSKKAQDTKVVAAQPAIA